MATADATLPSTEGTLYTAAADVAVVSVLFHNTNTTTETIQLWGTASGGTKRKILQKDIPANDTLVWSADEKLLPASGWVLSGLSTTASKVDMTLSYMAL